MLDRLAAEIRACTRCPLHRHRRNAVPGEGSGELGIMLVGEAPGRREDETGRPFVGAAGRLLDRALAAAGVARGGLYITNVVKCRPPNNREPTRAEVAACLPYLARQIAALRPRRIVALGRHSAAALLSLAGRGPARLSDLRGRCLRASVAGVEAELCFTYHPAAALYNPGLKEALMEDLRRFLSPTP